MKIILFIFLPFLLLSCSNKKPVSDILSPSLVGSQVFSVNPTSDTILRTSHGSMIRISKGSFDSDSSVDIEIKEVFTPQEILLSGLTTTSDGRPLSSAGMLYFNATVNGKIQELRKPVRITIPAMKTDPAMQVFQGEIKSDSNINWVDPYNVSSASIPDLEHSVDAGRALFRTNCASCHNIFKQVVGPALNNVQYRGPWRNPANIQAWINDPARFMNRDPYTRELKNKIGVTMPAFPQLNRDDVRDILAYINNAKQDEPLRVRDTAKKTDTSGVSYDAMNSDCGSDTVYTSRIMDFPEYDTAVPPSVLADTSRNAPSPYDPYYRDIYNEGYDFIINNNGWYNIDVLLTSDNKEIQNVKLVADMGSGERVYLNVYVFIPSKRIMESTNSSKGNKYYFDYDNGSIPLPVGERALILAFGSAKDRLLYGISEFVISKEQEVVVQIKETSESELKSMLLSKNMDGFGLEATEKIREVYKINCDDSTTINATQIISKDSVSTR